MGEGFTWDDETWERVWEQILTPVERHHIAMSVLRRRFPQDAMEARVALELARRWARRAVSLSLAYLLWVVFWGSIGWTDPPVDMALGCAAFGVVAIVACLWFRRRLVDYLRVNRGLLA